MDPKEELFNDHRYIAREVAMYYTRRYCRPFAETLDHAEFALALIACGVAGEYDPERGTVEGWLRFKMLMHLKDVYLRGYHPHCPNVRETHRRRVHVDSDLLEVLDETTELKRLGGNKPSTGWLDRLWAEVSEEAAALLEIICDAPHDLLLEICPTPGRTNKRKRRNLITYLTDVLDWPEAKVLRAFAEVESCVCR